MGSRMQGVASPNGPPDLLVSLSRLHAIVRRKGVNGLRGQVDANVPVSTNFTDVEWKEH